MGRRCRRAVIIWLAAVMALAGCEKKGERVAADYIGIEAAKEAALKASGVAAADAAFQAAGLDNKGDIFYYQVAFTGNGVAYEYAIDAMTGVVIEESHTTTGADYGEETGDKSGVRESAGLEQETGLEASLEKIDAAAAFAIALSHAGISEEALTYQKVKEKRDDGRQIFEVEFLTADGVEYDYELSADDGSILSVDYDAERLFEEKPAADTGMISEDQAIEIILERVPGAEAEQVALRLKEDNGRIEYKGYLQHEGMEYEFKLDAYSGGVIEWEAERIRP